VRGKQGAPWHGRYTAWHGEGMKVSRTQGHLLHSFRSSHRDHRSHTGQRWHAQTQAGRRTKVSTEDAAGDIRQETTQRGSGKLEMRNKQEITPREQPRDHGCVDGKEEAQRRHKGRRIQG
jgi:hypothetical protein